MRAEETDVLRLWGGEGCCLLLLPLASGKKFKSLSKEDRSKVEAPGLGSLHTTAS